MKMLIVGDPHVKYDDLEDCNRLMSYVYDVAKKEQCDTIVFMGDLFHNHAIVHVGVLNFWNTWLDKLYAFSVYLIKGNHDFGLGDPSQHSLIAFKNKSKMVTVVDTPIRLNKILLMPYYGPKKAEQFYETVRKSEKPYLLCHDTFQGSRFENGFYAPEGFDLDKVSSSKIISGHIHTPQKVGKCMYVGSPRWQTISDANTDRFLYVFDDDLNELSRHSTVGVCKSLWIRDVYSEKDVNPVNVDNSETRFNIHGKQSVVDSLIKLVKEKNNNCVTIPVVEREESVEVKESMGISNAYIEYASIYSKNKGLDDGFLEFVKKRAIWTI